MRRRRSWGEIFWAPLRGEGEERAVLMGPLYFWGNGGCGGWRERNGRQQRFSDFSTSGPEGERRREDVEDKKRASGWKRRNLCSSRAVLHPTHVQIISTHRIAKSQIVGLWLHKTYKHDDFAETKPGVVWAQSFGTSSLWDQESSRRPQVTARLSGSRILSFLPTCNWNNQDFQHIFTGQKLNFCLFVF